MDAKTIIEGKLGHVLYGSLSCRKTYQTQEKVRAHPWKSRHTAGSGLAEAS